MTPQRPDAHVNEDVSIMELKLAVVREMGWSVWDPRGDYGEDVLVRIFDTSSGPREATPYFFFVQAKSTAIMEKHSRDEGAFFSYGIDDTHLESWLSFRQPVIMTLYDVDTRATYWADVQAEASVYQSRHGNPYVRLEKFNLLDAAGLARIEELTRQRYAELVRETEAVSDLLEGLEQMGLQVDYDPADGLLMVRGPAFAKIQFFGPLARDLERVSAKRGVTPEVAFQDLLRLLDQVSTDTATVDAEVGGEAPGPGLEQLLANLRSRQPGPSGRDGGRQPDEQPRQRRGAGAGPPD